MLCRVHNRHNQRITFPPFVWIQLAGPYREIPSTKHCLSMQVCCGCGGIFSCSDLAQSHSFVSAPIACVLKVMPHTAHRRSLLSAARSSSKKTPHAQQCTSSLLIQCAHGKLNVNHYQTTPKPEIHISQ